MDKKENILGRIEYKIQNKFKILSPLKQKDIKCMSVIISIDKKLLSYKDRDIINSIPFNSKNQEIIPFIEMKLSECNIQTEIELISIIKEY